MCAFCSMYYYRSTMVRLGDGNLACTDGNCHTGLTAVELERENAMAAMGGAQPFSPVDW